MIEIREAAEADHEAIWEIFQEVVSAGDTFAHAPDTSRETPPRTL